MGNRGITAIDLFCGAGGLTYGLEHRGIRVAVGVDLDPQCEYPYTENTQSKFLHADVAEIDPAILKPYIKEGSFSVLVGCAPCQPFSTYTQGMKIRDSRWSLLSEFERIALNLKPDVISMENVPQLARHEIYDTFINSLKSAGYHVSENIVECKLYGVPQTRKRLVILASRFGEISFIRPTNESDDQRITVRHAIGDLPPLKAGEHNMKDRLHRASGMSEKNLKRIAASMPGGTWKDWDKGLRTKCHLKESGRHYGGVYGRMEWDHPAPTITTQSFGFGSGRFGHPEQDRALTLREAAILQTFPRHYKFVSPKDPISFKGVGKLIGNAVPVKLGSAIGKSIVEHLKVYA
jgi:DNA (cytosine-5)-methyltransferase 1